jgi:hypothetical protein
MKRKIIYDNDNYGGNKYDNNYFYLVATTISAAPFLEILLNLR